MERNADGDPPPVTPPTLEQRTRSALRRSSATLLVVGLASAVGVYLGHDWFHASLLPALGVSPALGDSIGGLAIILVAYLGQRLVSLALFKDTELGATTEAWRLERANHGLRHALDELDRLASTDLLTGAWNRRRLEESLRGEMDRLARHRQPLSLLTLDVDFFKSINDRHGHSTGDRVLVALATLIKGGLRSSDSLTRWGGEEFIVLCPNTTLDTACRLAERLRREIAAADFPHVGRITVSFGVAECLPDETWDQWFQRADAALYLAKSAGRDQVQAAPERPSAKDREERIVSRFQQLFWRCSYECGDDTIDNEHRALFERANGLLAAMLSGAPADAVSDMVDRFVTELESHFAHEEAAITTAGYPDTAAHVREHHRLLADARHLADRFREGSLDTGELFHFMAHIVVARHLLGADREFFDCIRAQAALPRTACPALPA